MIVKGQNAIVNFYATTIDGEGATGKTSNDITVKMSTNGGALTTVSGLTISEMDSTNMPGWYRFSYTFNTVGNVFLSFSCADCKIMPWEDDVIEMAALVNWAVSGSTLTLYNADNTVAGTYVITRDSSGNITSVRPN
ncbi:MAG: hypothetical protein IJG38_02315 [Thermoguttaceae bacterium]|nr:hypothetical protein [Thermoguttaceae bacterium]